jgi:hypothetical protein
LAQRTSPTVSHGFPAVVSTNELRVSASRRRGRNLVERTRWGGAAGGEQGGNCDALGTDRAVWKNQVPGLLRRQGLTEWPNCHRCNRRLITAGMIWERGRSADDTDVRSRVNRGLKRIIPRPRGATGDRPWQIGGPSPPGSGRCSGAGATASGSSPPAGSPGSP